MVGIVLEIIKKKITDLSHDPSNVRTHDEKNITAIKASLRKFGQQKPIVIDDKGTVIAGNGTLESAKALGWTEIECVVTELDSLNKTAFAIADNRTAELAAWDQTALDLQLKSLADLNMDMSEFDFDISVDDFQFKEPSEEKEKELRLVLTFETDEELENAFEFLNENGYKAKVM